jgi:hypothetical protein
VHIESCTQTFIRAVFIITQNWKPLKYPSIEEWIYKIWYFHRTEQDLATITI